MNKPKGYFFLGLGLFGAIALGIGCAEESQDRTVETMRTSSVNAQPEEVTIEVTLKDEAKTDVGLAAAEAPASSMAAPTNLSSMPVSSTSECSEAANPACQVTGAAPIAGAAAGIGPGLAHPGIGGAYGPGFGGYGGFGGYDGLGAGFAGDVPFGGGYGFDGPWFGLGYPFYVTDLIITDDDHHHRRHNDDDNNDDDNNDDDNSDDDDVPVAR